jgi:hypothetical protein
MRRQREGGTCGVITLTSLIFYPSHKKVENYYSLKGLFGKWRIQVDGRGLKEILGNFDL